MSLAYLQQYMLFDTGLNLSRATEVLEELMTKGKQAENTVRGYAHSFATFERWCLQSGHFALPSNPQTLKLFVSWAVSERVYKLSFVAHILAAVRDKHIRTGHPEPNTREVRELFSAAKRKLREKPQRKSPLTVKHLERMLKRLGEEPRDLRTRRCCVLALRRAGGAARFLRSITLRSNSPKRA